MRRSESWLVVAALLTVGLVAVTACVGALAVAEGPGRYTTYAGSSTLGAILTLCAGLGLVSAGLVTSLGRHVGRIAALAIFAGLTWSAPDWVSWQEGPAIVPSTAMMLAGFTFPLVVNLALAIPDDRTGSKGARRFVIAVYLEASLAAATLAMFRDPYFDASCWANCTTNSLLVQSAPSLSHAVAVMDRWFVAGAAVVVSGILTVRLAMASIPARRMLMPVAVPAIAFTVSVTARAIVLQETTIENPFNTPLFVIFAVSAVSLAALSAGMMWAVLRTRMQRRAVDRIVVNLDESAPPGSLESELAEAFGDPQLRIVYWLTQAGRYVDAAGRTVPEPSGAPLRNLTRLTRDDEVIAMISYAGPAADLQSQLGPAVRLGLENERLQAEVLAQLEELRASQARIIENADSERRSLERDLHDGAQQRLLSLSYDIRLAYASAQAGEETATETTLYQGIEAIHGALEELRELAHGLFPAVLAEAGLVAALATLADTTPFPVEIVANVDRRFPGPVEATAYFAVIQAVDDAASRGTRFLTVTVSHERGHLTVTVHDDGYEHSPTVAVSDRVGALGGSLVVEPTLWRLEIPCE